MTQIDLSQFAVGGAQRPDSFTGLDPQFLSALQAMIGGAPPEIQQNLRIMSGYRSPEKQAELWQGALQKYGSPEAARKWVAPPGKSFHNKGGAVDLKYASDAARKWAHENAGQFNLHFPLSNEDWHIEMAGSRGGQGHDHGPTHMAPGGAQGQGGLSMGLNPLGGGQEPSMGGAPGLGMNLASMGGGMPEIQSPLGNVFSTMAPNMPAQGPEMGAVQTSDPMAAPMAAMQNSEQVNQLQAALMPDIERLMGLSKRPVGV